MSIRYPRILAALTLTGFAVIPFAISPTEAVAATPTAVVAAATTTTTDRSCASDSTYDGGVCKVTFPPYTEDLSDEPTYPTYVERGGQRLRNYTEQVAHINTVHAAGLAECKSDLPYARADGWTESRWMAFCDGLPKPTVSYFQVKNVVTGEVR